MIPREYLKKIRQIEVRTNKLAQDLLAGAYHSVFKGRGMDFEEVREYQPGDDAQYRLERYGALAGNTYIKKHREERELTVMILVDVSASDTLRFGLADEEGTGGRDRLGLCRSARTGPATRRGCFFIPTRSNPSSRHGRGGRMSSGSFARSSISGHPEKAFP